MDIDGAALQAILASLKEQAVRVQAPMQEHADLGSAMLQLVEFEYVNGMEWGFHDKELRKDIAYSVSHSPSPPALPCANLSTRSSMACILSAT